MLVFLIFPAMHYNRIFQVVTLIPPVLIQLYFIGVTVANGEKDTLMCNGKYHALQINSDAVLVTRDYREFKFIEKTECSFTNLK